MEVILLERVEKLGHIGDVVRVKPGYARNFLLPQKKAVRATEDNRKRIDEQRAQLEAANKERRGEAEQHAGRLQDMTVTLIRQAGEAGQLYGSVNARDIAVAVAEASALAVRRQHVRLTMPIKAIGLHAVAVALHPEVVVTVTVNVARSQDEADVQARTGKAAAGVGALPPEPAEAEPVAEDFFEATAVADDA
jgi:large subunit ribosomal protein L9